MYRLCQHTKANGLRCQSPALRIDDYCHFHTALRRQQRELVAEAQRPTEFIAPNFNNQGDFVGMGSVRPRDIAFTRGVIRKPLELDLGLLEDAASIQLAVSNVLTALALGRLETRRASVLLYGLQLASNNVRNFDPTESATYEPDPTESGTYTSDPTESGIYETTSGEGDPTLRPRPAE